MKKIRVMKQLDLKKKILEACKNHQKKIIDNLKLAMKEAQQSANEYGPPKDRYDSFRMQLLRKKDMFGQQLEKALNEMYALEKINIISEIPEAGFGSVIITDQQKIFISIGIGKLEVDGDSYLAISLMVPLSQALSGKRKNDVIEFNGNKIKIIDVF